MAIPGVYRNRDSGCGSARDGLRRRRRKGVRRRVRVRWCWCIGWLRGAGSGALGISVDMILEE